MPRGEFGYALAIMESTLDTPENATLSSAQRTNRELNKRRKGHSVGIRDAVATCFRPAPLRYTTQDVLAALFVCLSVCGRSNAKFGGRTARRTTEGRCGAEAVLCIDRKLKIPL